MLTYCSPSKTLTVIFRQRAVSQFAEVKTKDRSRSKVKDTSAAVDGSAAGRAPIRGDRGDRRGADSNRGGRGRGTDRGRGGFRGGARGGAVNVPRTAGPSVPTTESGAWDVSKTPAAKPKEAAEAKEQAASEATKAPAAVPSSTPAPAPASAPARTWASLVATPKIAPTPPKPAVQPPPQSTEPPQAEPAAPGVTEDAAEPEQSPVAQSADDSEVAQTSSEAPTSSVPDKQEDAVSADADIPPSKDELTKDNVEHLPDVSHPPPTETAASTVASARDIGVATPLSTATQAPITRPVGGYATTALKATGGASRSSSFQRKIQEQQEAVVMPGNHAVDRAAVQFGSLGLSDEADKPDVDEDREEAETRTQPPQHSPVQPRASLPPAPRQAAPAAEPQAQDNAPAPKQAPGLPMPSQHVSQQSPPAGLGPQPAQQQGAQANQAYNQFGRFGQQPEVAPPAQKQYDAFGQPGPHASQYDYNSQQSHNVGQQPYSQAGGYSSAPDSFASQFSTSENQRAAYQNYGYNYQQHTPSQQEAGIAQPRTGSAFGSGPADTAFPPSQQQQTQGRYDAQNSGHNTPNPALGGQHPTGPASQAGPMHQPHGAGYGYNHPYYNSPYYTGYMNQFGNYGQQQGYGGFGKNMYNQPHHYGMSPQTSFDQHSSSPANVGSFGQSHSRDSGLGGGLGEYGRSVSQASQNQQGATAGSFGGLSDPFSRSQAYPGQASSYGQQQGAQQSGTEDSLKPFGESKNQGPSPSALGAQPGRPGSAANTPGQSGQGLPPQSHQPGFGGGYPGHLNQNSQYGGGLGGLGHGGGGNQGSQYGYNNSFGNSGYGSYNQRGWGNSYGGH
ncbi:hypothetical protein M011DRAFT_151872 [Sporormia fimetaria CBS 119925]|uniref:Uncharacterized protein n=1 Tax=Sporormia fimetaria CBS 119925 TaxID=1340428 RepID=A0A6A6V672_9PLEO|nr:hypothetical protein M011DRAFT_151872 [Sporormia fimetaria CBS 119925]